VIFLSVTAEEQGLLGSAYYTEHPLFPLDKTVANINIDGINAFGRTKDISISGAGQSQLEDYLQEEVSKHGRYVSPESHPEAGYFYRSDHFNFAKAGVPAFTTNAGIDNVARGKAYGLQQENDYTAKRYHQPSDEYDSSRWDLSGGMEDLNLLFQIGKRLAQGTEWPQWKPGSEFKAVREKSLNKG
jgi:Zn-dependent M28 family amino/carboxypeptidase